MAKKSGRPLRRPLSFMRNVAAALVLANVSAMFLSRHYHVRVRHFVTMGEVM
jgi:hypothetical protein